MRRPVTWRLCCAGVMLIGVLIAGACDCGVDALRGTELEVKILQPSPGPVSGSVPIEIRVTPESSLRLLQIYLTPQGLPGKSSRRLLIGELYNKPFKFQWNSFQVGDGYYRLQAVAIDEGLSESTSPQILIQVANEPPNLWFVNCQDGQFIRGVYSLVVSLDERETLLKEPPRLFLDGAKGPETLDVKPPYRYLLSTTSYPEGQRLSLAVEGEDFKGNRRRITCFPKVDNTPPSLRFRQPAQSDVLLGRNFTVLFDAFDRFGVKEVRLWVDGEACQGEPGRVPFPLPAPNEQDDTSNGEGCAVGQTIRIGRKSPLFPIDVELSSRYKTEQPIVLTARAVDSAGNLSEPPVQLRVRVDPIAPEIFIRSPGESELLWTTATFTARMTDNHLLAKAEFWVEGDGKKITLLQKELSVSEQTFSVDVADVRPKLGYGRKTFVVRATDKSGNSTVRKRLFLVGCGDSTDCPIGRICLKYRCLVPARLNEPCDPNTPCAIGLECMVGSLPVCGGGSKSFCRARCNPGNKFVPGDSCPPKFFCSKSLRVCMPGDKCEPLDNQCGSGRQCLPADDDAGMCAPVGSVPDGSPCGESCNASGNCRRGSWCVYLINTGGTACLRVCVVGRVACPAGMRCSPLEWSFGGGRLRYGVCQ